MILRWISSGVVEHRGAVGDPPETGGRLGEEQHGLGERGLARSVVRSEGDIADLSGWKSFNGASRWRGVTQFISWEYALIEMVPQGPRSVKESGSGVGSSSYWRRSSWCWTSAPARRSGLIREIDASSSPPRGPSGCALRRALARLQKSLGRKWMSRIRSRPCRRWFRAPRVPLALLELDLGQATIVAARDRPIWSGRRSGY